MYMTVKNLCILIRHDIISGVRNKWKAYLGALILFSFLLFSGMKNISLYYQNNGMEGTFGLAEILIYIFLGNEPFNPSSFSGIDLSMEWFSFFAYLAFITGFYPNDELQKSADSFLVRVQSRRLWWSSKFIWCFFAVCVYFFLFIVVAVIFVSCFGDITSWGNRMLMKSYFNVDIGSLDFTDFALISFLLPMIIAIAIAQLQMVLSFILKPIFSFLIIR